MVVTVSFVFWLRFEPHIRPTRLAINFLFITARAERNVRLCAKLFDFFRCEYSSVWPEICCVLSQIHWRFLRGISRKNYFRRIFQKFCANQDYPLRKHVKFHPTFCNFILGPYCAEKIHTSISYVVCTQVRRHVHKQITKRRYGEEKPGHLVFEKPVLFALGLGLTTPYSLGILVLNFYQTFVTVSVEF